MREGIVQLSVPLSRLVPTRKNPRKVKPNAEADASLVALIRSLGLIQPLVVRPLDDKRFEVLAGARRLRALKEIHRIHGASMTVCARSGARLMATAAQVRGPV